MLNSMGLGFVFTAHDLASSKMMSLERHFMSLDRKVGLGTASITSAFGQLGIGLGVMTAGLSMVGGAFVLADKAGQFEQAIAAVAAVSGATKSELAQLKDAAIDAGIATQFSPTEATVGLKELAQAGFNAQDSIKLLIPVLDLAGGSLGELSPAQAAGLASQALKAFGLSADEAGISVDRMLQAVNLFALNASELPIALGISSRGAQALHQSMSETLISLGLVKNIIPTVERASTGLAVSMERMADPKTQSALKGIGVAVTDNGGHFRSFLDIIGDMAPELNKMTDAKRSAFLIDTFGAHALGSMQAILTQVTTGIKTNTGATLKGSDAVAYLRQQFENAGGSAASFRDKMLDTFAGQKQLLSGSMETLAIVVGEPFAQVFKPIIGVVIDALNGFLRFVRAMPGPVKKGFASLFVGAGAILTLVGAVIAAKAGLVLLVIGLQAAGITIGGVLSVMLPAIAIVAAVGLAIAGLYVAFQKNVGGIADFALRMWVRVSVFFDALKQLIEQGGFSGAVREELNRAENAGLKAFLINLFLWGNRIAQVLSGIATGFAGGIESARPSIDAFIGAIEKVGVSLGFLSERDDAAIASGKFKAFGTAGQRIGVVLAKAFELVLQVMTGVLLISSGIGAAWKLIRPAADMLGASLSQLGGKLSESMNALHGNATAAQGNGNAWVSAGNTIGEAIALIVAVLSIFVSIVSAAVSIVSGVIGALAAVFSGLADVVTGVVFVIGGIFSGSWSDIWTGMKLIAFGVIDAIIGAVLELAGAIGGVIDSIAGAIGSTTSIQSSIRDFKGFTHREMARDFGVESLSFTPVNRTSQQTPSTTAPGHIGAMPAVAALPGPAPMSLPSLPAQNTAPQQPVIVNVQLDGQTIARAVHKAGSDTAGRSFSPVPSY